MMSLLMREKSAVLYDEHKQDHVSRNSLLVTYFLSLYTNANRGVIAQWLEQSTAVSDITVRNKRCYNRMAGIDRSLVRLRVAPVITFLPTTYKINSLSNTFCTKK